MGNAARPNERPRKLDVEKWIWTDADFERMGWHDVQLHGIARYEKVQRNEEEGSEGHFSGVELLLDIDYILKWAGSDNNFEFWIAPSTLVFDGVLDFQIEWIGMELQWEMDQITRESARYPSGENCWRWKLYGTGMTFLAKGYKQYIRREPVLTKFQSLTWEERGGNSFSKQTAEKEERAKG